MIQDWPTKKYSIIYADPPWEVMAGSKQSRKYGDSQKTLPLKYPVMKLDEIINLQVKGIKEKDSVLFLWTINKYLEQSYDVARAWGFIPSTMLVWDKTPKGIGLGGTFTLANEYLLFCRSGYCEGRICNHKNTQISKTAIAGNSVLYGHYAGNNKSFPDFVQMRKNDTRLAYKKIQYHIC